MSSSKRIREQEPARRRHKSTHYTRFVVILFLLNKWVFYAVFHYPYGWFALQLTLAGITRRRNNQPTISTTNTTQTFSRAWTTAPLAHDTHALAQKRPKNFAPARAELVKARWRFYEVLRATFLAQRMISNFSHKGHIHTGARACAHRAEEQFILLFKSLDRATHMNTCDSCNFKGKEVFGGAHVWRAHFAILVGPGLVASGNDGSLTTATVCNVNG